MRGLVNNAPFLLRFRRIRFGQRQERVFHLLLAAALRLVNRVQNRVQRDFRLLLYRGWAGRLLSNRGRPNQAGKTSDFTESLTRDFLGLQFLIRHHKRRLLFFYDFNFGGRGFRAWRLEVHEEIHLVFQPAVGFLLNFQRLG